MAMARMLEFPHTFDGAMAALDGEHFLRLGHNTFLQTVQGVPAVTYHRTPIVLYHEDGSVTVDDGGYGTRTTIDRIRHFLPEGFGLDTEPLGGSQWELFLWAVHPHRARRVRYGGVRMTPEGEVVELV